MCDKRRETETNRDSSHKFHQIDTSTVRIRMVKERG